MPVSEELLEAIADEKKGLRLFRIGETHSLEEMVGCESEMDTLRSQIDAGVQGLCVYSDKLEDEQALHIFANREPFWKIFATLTAASSAEKSVKARFKAIEDERLAISSQMDTSFERDLVNRFARVHPGQAIVTEVGSLADADTGNATDRHLRRLTELVFGEKDLERTELYREVADVESLSKELLRLTERAFVQAGLLELDGNSVMPRPEERGTPRSAPRVQASAQTSDSPPPAATPGVDQRNQTGAQPSGPAGLENEKTEISKPREEQVSDQRNAQELVHPPVSDESSTSPLDVAATMTRMGVQKRFEEVRNEFRAKEIEFEEGKHRHLTQKDLAAYPQALSEDEKGVVLVLKLQSHTEAYRLAEERFHAWREAAVKFGLEPELPENKATEIAPDRSDDGYPDVVFVAKKGKAGPRVERWRSDARARKSPSLASSRSSSVNARVRDMDSLAFDEDVQDEAAKSLWPDRIKRIEQERQDLRKTGSFENAENDFHPRNRKQPKRSSSGAKRAASI